MIDLKKEHEVFARHFGLPKSNENNPILQCGWLAWKTRAELAKAEITELKQKLEKIESGDFVLVPREPSAEILEDLAKEYRFTHPDDAIHEAQDSYKAMIEAVENKNAQ